MGDCLIALSRFITRGSRRYRAEQQAGFTQDSARTGAVTLIQRFGAALNLNIHFHMLFLDGVYVDAASGVRLSG